MSFSNYVNVFHTHSQSFKHFRTSVATVVPKFILSVTLVVIGHKVVTRRATHFSWVMGDLCCCIIKYSKCEITIEVLSLLTLVSLVLHLAFSEKASQLRNLASPSLPELCTV